MRIDFTGRQMDVSPEFQKYATQRLRKLTRLLRHDFGVHVILTAEKHRRIAVAVGLCSLLFASYHIYHGPIALLDIAVFGLVFGIWTHKARSIWPAVVAHTAYNLYVWIYAALEYAPGA